MYRRSTINSNNFDTNNYNSSKKKNTNAEILRFTVISYFIWKKANQESSSFSGSSTVTLTVSTDSKSILIIWLKLLFLTT